MKRFDLTFLFALIAATAFAGCVQTKSEVDVKPVDINLNITGRLEVVITDARRAEEEITGSKPKRTVTPQDIGLPAAPAASSRADEIIDPLADREIGAGRLILVADDTQAQLIQKMAARHPQIQALLDSQALGESHTGYLVPRASITASQQALVDADNSDRTQMYNLEAAKKGTSLDQVALGYYLARLEHVNKGTWVDQFNKSTGSWEWFQWNR
ncbi:MAG: DUF1318 domain-containing protein [Candidatus Binatus sp.]|uniref:DUF1318 domain-containing protein n=1 Tax=Candidatus Binatus sp. TaxID=2811406 RepID=UPI002724C2E1|nr:DUF1318 domain-containing protein [Candidatus Binatus sp.]MDO8433801.1 DUF1318 domain-containing protein [Candidatus Binatus sp.]